MSDARGDLPVTPHMTLSRLARLALLIGAVSCTDAVGPGHQLSDLDQARRLWRSQNLHTYAFTVQRSCFCVNVHPLYVFVLSDTVAEVLDTQTGEMVDRQLGETVESLFTFIQNATEHSVELIRATYDGTKGFPTEIDYDGSAQIADDEISYRVGDVHVITPATSSVVTLRP